MNKKIVTTCILVFSTLQSWASADLPVEPTAIDPPPETAPIDGFLPMALFMAVTFAAYYFYNNARSTSSK